MSEEFSMLTQGSAHGQVSLRYCYDVGVGVEQNDEEVQKIRRNK